MEFIRKEVPQILFDTDIFDKNDYLIKSSAGMGNWATVPWIAILDPRITTSAQEGEYIAYLLSAGGRSLYLTFSQGFANIRNEKKIVEARKLLRQKSNSVVKKIDARGFFKDDTINLYIPNPNMTSHLYESGTIFYKEYKRGEVPDESELLQDLKNMKLIYTDYYEQIFIKGNSTNEPEQIREKDKKDNGNISREE